MCDTIGRIVNEHYAIFGKNSDRAVNEPQVIEFYPAKDYEPGAKLHCTYREIDQVEHTHAILLSRPTWIWGGEIGVNEFGVCIGNEAVFTKGKYGKQSLIGMDLLRLGLERADTAYGAMQVIIALLGEYGQGGNCGFDSKFEYNNSFLIMDRTAIYVLDTVGKDWVYKKVERAGISNALNIGSDGDIYADEPCDFYHKYADSLMTFGAGAKIRRGLSCGASLENAADMAKLLSAHQPKVDPFSKGSVQSVCMHAANSLTADQTTMSMIVELLPTDMRIWVTGCSLPCVSLFKPVPFGVGGLAHDGAVVGVGNAMYWRKMEAFHRDMLCAALPTEYFEERDAIQTKIFEDNDIASAMRLDDEFYEKWRKFAFVKKPCSCIYKNFWKKKNKAF